MPASATLMWSDFSSGTALLFPLPKSDAGLLAQVKEDLGNMTENMQADCVPSRQARFNQCFLKTVQCPSAFSRGNSALKIHTPCLNLFRPNSGEGEKIPPRPNLSEANGAHTHHGKANAFFTEDCEAVIGGGASRGRPFTADIEKICRHIIS